MPPHLYTRDYFLHSCDGYPLQWRMHRMVRALPAWVWSILLGEVPPLPPRDPRALDGRGPEIHVNKMTIAELRRVVKRHGFKGRVWLSVSQPVYRGHSLFRRWTWVHRLLDLWPIASLFPFNRIFAMHLFAVIEKQGGRER